MLEDARYILAARQWLTPAIAELRLEPASGRRLDYKAGQYVVLTQTEQHVPDRSYSIANAPGVPRMGAGLSFLITEVPGGPTSHWLLHQLKPGDPLLLSGPYGSFTLRPVGSNSILAVAGGSGWAPIRALAQAALDRGSDQRIDILFSARSEADVMDRALVAQWQASHKAFSFTRTLTRQPGPAPNGRIQQVMPGLWPDLSQRDVYVAGPSGLVAACTETARKLGVQDGHLHTEEFYSDPLPWG